VNLDSCLILERLIVAKRLRVGDIDRVKGATLERLVVCFVGHLNRVSLGVLVAVVFDKNEDMLQAHP